MDFHENLHMSIFLKYAETIKVSLKSDKSGRYFTQRPMTFFIIPHSVLLRMRNVPDKTYTFFVQ